MHPDFYTLEIEQATGPGSAGVVFLPRLGLIYIALPNASGTVNVSKARVSTAHLPNNLKMDLGPGYSLDFAL